MCKIILILSFIFSFQLTFAAENNCLPQNDSYYETNIVGKRLETDGTDITIFNINYDFITEFKKNHHFVCYIVNRDNYNDKVIGATGTWEIKNGYLYYKNITSYVFITIPNFKDKILCMNETFYKGENSDTDKSTYQSKKI